MVLVKRADILKEPTPSTRGGHQTKKDTYNRFIGFPKTHVFPDKFIVDKRMGHRKSSFIKLYGLNSLSRFNDPRINWSGARLIRGLVKVKFRIYGQSILSNQNHPPLQTSPP